jgi:hypothetical protein
MRTVDLCPLVVRTAVVVLLASITLPGQSTPTASSGDNNSALVKSQGATAKAASNYGHLPLSFIPNVGQTDPQVKFLSGGKGYEVFLTEQEAVLSLKGTTPIKLTGLAETARAGHIFRPTDAP